MAGMAAGRGKSPMAGKSTNPQIDAVKRAIMLELHGPRFYQAAAQRCTNTVSQRHAIAGSCHRSGAQGGGWRRPGSTARPSPLG
jgi:hypothetical protein